MLKPSVKNKILLHLNNKGWVSKASLESMSREWGVLADNIDRRCRELVNEGKIERMKIGKSVQYRIHQPSMHATEANAYLKSLAVEEERQRQVSFI